jgi:chromosome segregation ATPase
MPRFPHLLPVVVLSCIALLGSAAWGQNRPNKRNAPAAPTPPSHQAIDDAAKAVADARGQATKAESTLAELVAKLRKDQEAAPEVAAALKAVKEAQETFDTARQPVLDELGKQPEYQAAVAAREALKARVRDAQAATAPNPDTLRDLAVQVMNADSAVGKLEAAALALDPKVKQAQEKLDAAATALAALKAKGEEAVKQNPEYASAKKALDDARTQLAAAERALAQAQQKFAADQAAYQTAAAEAQKEAQRQADLAAARNGNRRTIIRVPAGR